MNQRIGVSYSMPRTHIVRMEAEPMSRIQCPRCKAINDDASADDPCRNCGTILNAPLSALDGAGYPPSSAANGADQIPSKTETAQQPALSEQAPDSGTKTEKTGGEARYE